MIPPAAAIQSRALHSHCRCMAPFSALLHAELSLHSKDGAVGKRILAGTVLSARVRVGLGGSHVGVRV
jgi:hypothetical protein